MLLWGPQEGSELVESLNCDEQPAEIHKSTAVEEAPPETVTNDDENCNGSTKDSDKADFDDNAVDYEPGDDLALEFDKEEFLDLIEEVAEVVKPPSGCFYCDDVTVDVSDSQTYAAHLKERHSVRKNVHFLAEVTIARQRQGKANDQLRQP
jgi:hypothetical protein